MSVHRHSVSICLMDIWILSTFLVPMNKTAMHIHVESSEDTCFHLFGYIS